MKRRIMLLVGVVLAIAVQSTAECAVETDLTWREKRAERRLRDDALDARRYVDNGFLIRVVVADPDGERLVRGNAAKLRVVEELGPYGGLIDTKANPPHYVGDTRAPVIWYCSQDQAECIKHDDPNKPGQWIEGSEGSGKTTVLAMLHAIWWARNVGQPLPRFELQSAPTKRRLKHVLNAMRGIYPRRWFKWHKADLQLTFCDGHVVQFLSTKQQSEAEGSPIQGDNALACGRDEQQDQIAADPNLESRGRAAKVDRRTGESCYWQAATATVKSSSEYRDLRALKINSGLWVLRRLLIANSPFIPPSFLERVRRVMTDREYRRRFWCEDLPSERAVYFKWSRADNLRAVPPTAKRVTSIVLQAKLRRPYFHLLAGHDPGASKAATVYLDAYACGCSRICTCGLRELGTHAWWVRGERFTTNKTSEDHAKLVLADVRNTFGYNLSGRPERVHVRAHPYGQSEDKPSLNLYKTFERVGLHVKAAQHRRDGKGTGLITKEDRFELVNRMLCDADGRRRLFVEVDKKGQPVAPLLVEGFETMERDERGLGEHEKKDQTDKSDPPAALGYALWPFEKESASHLRDLMRELQRGG